MSKMNDEQNCIKPALSSDEGKPSVNNGKVPERNKMALKTTVVSVSDNDGSDCAKWKTEKVEEVVCNGFHIILAVALVTVAIAFTVILALYIREKRDSLASDSLVTSNKTCFQEGCISSAAGKISTEDFYAFI